MAFSSGAVWEYQTGGNQNYGGGFDSTISGAGTDYSQQVTAALALSDLACTTGTSTLTSANGGFTSAMVGNAINIVSGTNFTAGFYFITGYTNGNTVTLDRSPVGGSSGSSGVGNVGGCLLVPIDAHFEAFVAGNKVWIKTGSYTITASIAVASTSATVGNPIVVEGYYSSRADMPIESNLPALTCGAYSITFGIFWRVSYLSGTGTTSPVFASHSSGGAVFDHCKVLNNSTSADRTALYLRNSIAYSCNLASTNGYAVYSDTSLQSMLIFCNLHDSKNGCTGASASFVIQGCAIHNCSVAAFTAGSTKNTIFLSIIYDCVGGVKFVNYGYSSIVGCIISGNTTGISQNANYVTNFAYNCLFYDNDTNASNFALDSSNVTGSDPLFTDPENGDFTLQSGSPALNAGFDLAKIGLTGAYKWNIGIDQGDHVASGGTTCHMSAF